MPLQDGDSSSDDELEYNTTNVILGYASGESSGDEISHLGGHPSWLQDDVTPPASFAECKQHFPHDSRRLQVWYCRNKTCSRKAGSIRALREVRKRTPSKKSKSIEPTTSQRVPPVDLGSALFGGNPTPGAGNINPFSASTASQNTNMNIFHGLEATSSLAAKPPQTPVAEVQPPTESFAEKLKLDSATSKQIVSAKWPEQSAFPDPFPFFYLDAYPEELEPIETADEPVAGSSNTKYDSEDVGSGATEKDSADMIIDKTFQKFSDMVAQNPEQVLRYEFKGQPLLYSGTDAVATRFIVPHGKAGAIKGMPRCENCGAQRVFELQLTPYLIFEIEKDETMDINDGMEWGTIIVGSCSNNCGNEGTISFREEWVGVQWEERTIKK